MRFGLAYGLLSSRRRAREMVLPAVTTATGAFLVVVVFAMSAGIRRQSAGLGHADQIGRAVVLIAITVLLVGVVEVAVSTTRTIAHRTREIGVLGANGVPAVPVVTALLVEPVAAATAGALGGAVLGAVVAFVLDALGMAASGASVAGAVEGVLVSLVVSLAASIVTSFVPTWRAVSRPPVASLTA